MYCVVYTLFEPGETLEITTMQYQNCRVKVALYPGSQKGRGGTESLVHTVCTCSRNSQKSGGGEVFVRILSYSSVSAN